MSRKGILKGLAGIAAAATISSAGSGCYMTHGPYFDVRVSKPSFETERVEKVKARPTREPLMVFRQCDTYARAGSDSPVAVCRCHYDGQPDREYTCRVIE